MIFAWTILPDQLGASARDAGLELEFGALRSPHPGRVVLDGPILRGLHGWSFRAGRLDAATRGYLPFGKPWQLDRCSVSDLFIEHQSAGIGPIRASLAAPLAARPGRLDASGSEVRAHVGDWSADLGLHLQAQIEHWHAVDDLLLADGSLSVSSVQPKLRAVLQLETASVSPGQGLDAIAQLTLTGDDAGLWLDIARLDDNARWLLAELIGMPFELAATVSIRHGWLRMRDIRFEAGPTGARGELRSDGEAVLGAVLVRRGPIALGLSLSDAAVRAQLMPPPNWLELQLNSWDAGSAER